MVRALGASVVAASVLAGALVSVHGPAEAALTPSTCADIEQLAENFAGHAHVAVVDLQSGERCDFDAATPTRSASLYKLFVMLEVFDQVDRGALSFDDWLTIEPRHTIDDPEGFRATVSRTVSIGEAVDEMITVSDNGSAVALMERLTYDRVATIASRFDFPGTTLAEDTYETSAEDVASFFERLYAGELINPLASGRMLEILRRQRINTMLPLGLPEGTTLAHKTGNLDYYAHDAGLVTAPGGSYVVVAMTEADPLPGIEASYTFIPALASLTYDALAEPRPIGTPVETFAPAPAAATVAQPAADAGLAGSTPVIEAAPASVQPIPTVTPSWFPIEVPPAAGASAAGVAAMAMALATFAIWTRRRGAHEHVVSISAQESGDSRMTITRRPDYAADEPRDPSRKDPVMRLRKQQNDDTGNDAITESEAATVSGQEAQLTPAAAANTTATAANAALTSTAASAPGVIDSPRLRRLAQYFSVQKEMLDGVRSDVEQETAPLIDLLLRQANTMQRVMSNLDERLRPLETYAETEEANLAKLRERLSEDGTEFLNRSFSDYIAQQRERINDTRTRIGEQRVPFERFADDEQGAVETALARFDQDVALLEEIQAEQRRVTTRLLEAMRSDTFLAVKDYLAERHEALVDLSERNVTDPTAIAGALRAKASAVPQAPSNAPGAQHLAEVLRSTSEADARFAKPAEAAAARASAEAKKARTAQTNGANSTNGNGSNGATHAEADTSTEDTGAPADSKLIEAVDEMTEQESRSVTRTS
ncbi:MAG: serine hydrolase [Dehalococcoidia bacterium]